MKSNSRVQRARQRLLERIDEAGIARGELRVAVDWQDTNAMTRWQATCRRAEAACERAISAYSRAIRIEGRTK